MTREHDAAMKKHTRDNGDDNDDGKKTLRRMKRTRQEDSGRDERESIDREGIIAEISAMIAKERQSNNAKDAPVPNFAQGHMDEGERKRFTQVFIFLY